MTFEKPQTCTELCRVSVTQQRHSGASGWVGGIYTGEAASSVASSALSPQHPQDPPEHMLVCNTAGEGRGGRLLHAE